ncbi:uncharacterized protein Z519_03648 [Cladophialophora bantiana CBS 173.52]|uniref:PHD-type domain-containing protein n=1 Tax=Cladophialophora bantiana (strain ATCC 10958 / CBS 173.52 / CDC B-1940 / NIH 8579) TaxID=1442370 RepID=A0A0D2EYN2_CLAB1|nr:uncharacterized protein Z519_03648 [Cladophialophora bantiana CBS 173.52]KIW95066.1 hypothetical protein Z519_03648 [Cladophialophora bantiana CBS 173.52]
MPRKRTRDEMEVSEPEEKKQEPSLLQRIRNMWEFACVMQFIFFFGKAIKIDEDFDIEDFESECLKPGYSEKLEEIGLTLLKWISSHRGLNYDIWDEYTRRQYLAKAPRLNPYGNEEEPKRFRDFDIFTKIRILHQLTIWTFWNPDRIREKMTEQPREIDQTEWRIEEFGYDRHDRLYYLLDDNRFYRRTEPPLPQALKAKPKANSKKAIAARRRESKRRKLEAEAAAAAAAAVGDGEEENEENTEETEIAEEENKLEPWQINTFGGFKWECLCITLADYQELCESFKKSKDPNEKALRERLIAEVIPIIEAAEERQRRKMERRERELLMMERMVGAKRSSRLADKHERERREAEQAEAEKRKQADLIAARREQERQEKMEQERQYRMMTREQRIKDRELKRLLKEEELARDALEQKRIEEGEARGSDRALKQRIERNKKELEELEAEEDWTFDCSGCGKHGKNFDDGSHSISCERCNVWQHSKCLGISKSAAEKDDFHFICKDCRRKEEDAKRPKISLKFRVGTSSSPVPPSPVPATSKVVAAEVPTEFAAQSPSQGAAMTNGHQYSPSNQPASPSQRLQSAQMNGVHPQQRFGPTQQMSLGPAQHQPTSTSPRQQQNFTMHPIQPYPSGLSNGTARSPPPQGQGNYPVFYNNIHHQNSTGQRPLAPSPIPRHPPQNSSTQAMPNSGRLPSPVVNRPTISPTQGNMDVGPVAGIPQKADQFHQQAANGVYSPANSAPSKPLGTPRPISQDQPQPTQTPISRAPTYPLSGLSPKKQQTPGPLPPFPATSPRHSNPVSSPPTSSSFPQTISPTANTGVTIPSTACYTVEKRAVSGTPILPPVENLRPSPEQLRNMSSTEPVPTPSKQFPPLAQVQTQARNQAHIHSRPDDELQAKEQANSEGSGLDGTTELAVNENGVKATEGGSHVDANLGSRQDQGTDNAAVMRDVEMQDVK